MKKITSLFLSLLMIFTIIGSAECSYAAGIYNVSYNGVYHQTEARKVLAQINSFRAEKDVWYWNSDGTKTVCSNLSGLKYDYELEKAAMKRAAELAVYCSHTRPNNTSTFTVFDEYGIDYAYAGENIAAGYTSASLVHTAWREDNENYANQGHRRAMLNKNYNCVGVACFEVNGCYYWVEEFSYIQNVNTKSTTANNSSTNVTVKLSDSFVTKADISLSGQSVSTSVGKTAQLPTATAVISTSGFFHSNPNVTSIKVTPQLSYKSADSSIAAVSGSSVTGKKAGKTTVTASAFGKSKNITVNVTAAAPKATSISSLKAVANGFTVNWSKVSDTTGYQVQYSTKADFSNAATVYGGATNTTSKTITGRAAGTKYYVRVRTYKNINGNYVWGAWSAAKNVTTPTKPSTTSITSVSGVKNGFTVKWKKISNTTGYQIQYSTRSDFKNAATVYGGAANTTSKTITGRAAGTKYYVRVRTYKNVNGTYVWGNWTAAKTVTTKK